MCAVSAARLASYTCSRPFTSVCPTVKPVVEASLCRLQRHYPACRTRRCCKQTLYHGWSPHRKLGRSGRRSLVKTHAATDPLVPLGLDFLTFLAATVLVIPLFKSVKASPVLGFLFSGLLLGQLGLVPVLWSKMVTCSGCLSSVKLYSMSLLLQPVSQY